MNSSNYWLPVGRTRRDPSRITEVVIPIAVPVVASSPLSIIHIQAQIVLPPPPVRIPGSVWGPTCQKCGKQFERNLNLVQSDKNYYNCPDCLTFDSQSCVIQ